MPNQGVDYLQKNRDPRKQMADSIMSIPEIGQEFGPPPSPQAAQAAQGLYKTGLDLFLSGDQDTALAHWQQALTTDPSNMEARRGVEHLMKERAGVQQAPVPESMDAYRAGLATFLSGDDVGAAKQWEKAYGADHGNQEAKIGLERILMRLRGNR